MRVRALPLTVSVLMAVGLFFFGYKLLVLDFPLLPKTVAESWKIEVKVSFIGSGGATTVRILSPRGSDDLAIVDPNFLSSGYELSVAEGKDGKIMILSTQQSQGIQNLYYTFVASRIAGPARLRPPSGAPTMRLPRWSELELAAARSILEAARPDTADSRALTEALFAIFNGKDFRAERGVLVGRHPSQEKTIETIANLLAFAHVPSRSAHGIELDSEGRDAIFVHWVELFDGGAWQAVWPNGAIPAARKRLLTWWHGPGRLVRVDGGEKVRTTITATRRIEPGVQSALSISWAQRPEILAFSLFSLPLDAQRVFRILLTIPIGALLLVVFRNVIGVATFGTFMPVLIALSFRETRLLWGVALFGVVIAAGLAARLCMDRLRLLVVPRLASILITVILVIMVMSIVSHRLGIKPGLSVALFPIVILSMTVERMSIVWDERGVFEALKEAAGSLLVASLCYLVVSHPYVEHLMFVFPSLLLCLLAITMLLGRYSGYRLTELLRFRSLGKEGG